MDDHKLNTVTKLTAILTCFSLIVGIALGLIKVADSLSKANTTLEKANETLDAIKVNALSNVIDILDMNNNIRLKQVAMDKTQFNEKIKSVNELLNSGKTGEQIYYSESMKEFREVVAHYERLAALIKLNYLDFLVIFNVITFPDNFFKNSKELRDLISYNWDGKGKPLSDFLSGFSSLCESYKKERLAHGHTNGKNMVCN